MEILTLILAVIATIVTIFRLVSAELEPSPQEMIEHYRQHLANEKRERAHKTPAEEAFERDKQKINLPDDVIQEHIMQLKELLPPEPTKHNAPFLVALDEINKDRVRDYFQQYTDDLLLFLQIQNKIKVLFVDSISDPVMYVMYDGVHLLEINLSLKYPDFYRAAIYHELMRFYLPMHHVSLLGDANDVSLKDLALVYLGLGFEMLKEDTWMQQEWEEEKKEKGLKKSAQAKISYTAAINRSSINRAIIATAKVRQQPSDLIINHFEGRMKKWVGRRLKRGTN